jgi:hypothetical protein
VRFLVDESLSPRLCGFLTAEGDTAQHVWEVLGSRASDHEVMRDVIVAEQSSSLLTPISGHCWCRVGGRSRRSFATQARLLVANLDQIRDVLITGAISSSLDDIRVRPFPLAPHS